MREDQKSLDAEGINEECDCSEIDSFENTIQLGKMDNYDSPMRVFDNKEFLQTFFDVESRLREVFDGVYEVLSPHEIILKEFSNLSSSVGKWPPIDLREDIDNYYIDIGISGFKKEDVDIDLKESVVVISR
jgi:HSP20 family molecular chaperone IbpA